VRHGDLVVVHVDDPRARCGGRSILAREHGHLEAICDALIASLAGRCEDDVTVILARIPADRAG
jgi:hypothetical protein